MIRILLLTLAATTLTVVLLAAGCAEAPKGPLLSYFTVEGAEYRWKFWDATAQKETTFLELHALPNLIFWDTKELRVYFALESQIQAASYPRERVSAAKVTPLPATAGRPVILWVEESTGKLRLIDMQEIPHDSILKSPEGKLTYRAPDGVDTEIPIEPSWGLPYLCTVLELGDGEKWGEVVRIGTKWEAGDTPGFSVADAYRHERGFSQAALLRSYTCESGQCRETPPEMLNGHSTDELLHEYQLKEPAYLELGTARAALIFSTLFGDTTHATTPVLLIRKGGAGVDELKMRPGAQIAIGLQGRYLLVAEEYTGSNPRVIDLDTGQSLFSRDAKQTVWVPGI